MTKEEIDKIEKELSPNGLTGYIFYIGKFKDLCEVTTLEEGACLVIKGLPKREGRKAFFRIIFGL